MVNSYFVRVNFTHSVLFTLVSVTAKVLPEVSFAEHEWTAVLLALPKPVSLVNKR